jgi:DNA helicase-2/ATP-dependent DNA helicase PcrA
VRDLGLNGQQSPHAAQFTGKTGALLSLGKLLAEWHDSKEDLSVIQLLDLILDGVNYMDYVNDGSAEGEERWENVLELRNVAAASPEAGLTEFLEQVALVADQDTLGEEGEAATLLTLHAAKGLEFPVVFMIGLDEGVLPHQRSFDDPESMHEERRLMYVGMTRAKDRLYLVRAFRRSQYGDSGVADASRFLQDIPAALMVGNMERQQSRAESYFKKATTWDTSGASTAPSWETDRNASHP